MKLLFNTLIVTSVLSFALTAQAKIGDTFTDPEFGKITVKGPSFPNEDIAVFDKDGIKKTKQRIMSETTSKISVRFERIVDRLHPNMTEKEIIAETKEFIDNFKALKPLRKSFYIDGYNPKMLMLYTASIENGQRAVKYKFWDYFVKIKDKPEYNQLMEEIKFSSQTLRNLKLYEEE